MRKALGWMAMGVWLAGAVTQPAQGEPVHNGNELALALATTNAAGRAQLAGVHVRALHAFRHLAITAIERDTPEPGAVTLRTREPSSDLPVTLVVRHALSLQLAATLQTNDAVAVNGRVIRADAAGLTVDPAVLKRKDRASPKPNNELLSETDPTAH